MNKIIHGDCLNEMQSIPSKTIQLILTDLPYGITACGWDIVISFKQLWEQYNRIIKDNGAILLFGQEPFSSHLRLSNIENYKYDWYWKKERITNIQQVKKRAGKVIETISVFYKTQCLYKPQMFKHNGRLRSNKIGKGVLGKLTDIQGKQPFEYADNGTRYPHQLLKFKRDILTSNLHPTQKPLALCEFLIQSYTNQNDIVLDSCAGSGTTGLAAKNTDRQYILIEKELKYIDVIKNRLINS